MKKIILTISAVMLFSSFQQTDDSTKLKVIKVVGTIVVKDTQKILATSDEISVTLPLDFKTADARAAVINLKNKSRYILTSESSVGNTSTLTTAKTHLIPSAILASSRGGSLLNIIDIQNHFTGNYVILNKTELKINPQNFPMNDTHIFYIRYKYSGEEINKKLDYKHDTLIIDKITLYQVDNKVISSPDDASVKLFYMEGNKSTLISEFSLIFPDNNTLKQEIGVIWKELSNKSSNQRNDEIVSYINEFYGKPDKENVVEWLKLNF
jgi:hypothetical protein